MLVTKHRVSAKTAQLPSAIYIYYYLTKHISITNYKWKAYLHSFRIGAKMRDIHLIGHWQQSESVYIPGVLPLRFILSVNVRQVAWIVMHCY